MQTKVSRWPFLRLSCWTTPGSSHIRKLRVGVALPSHLPSIGPWGTKIHLQDQGELSGCCHPKREGWSRKGKNKHRKSPQGEENEDFSEDGVKGSVFNP